MESYGLLGFPLGHSFSKDYFEKKFCRENLSAKFLNFELPDLSKLEQTLINTINLKGFSVTIPYKERIIPLLTEIDPIAQQIGAVNAVAVEKTSDRIFLKGYNTDYLGFGKSLDQFLGKTTINNALILGTGGASKAIAYALAERNISFKKVSRTPLQCEIAYDEIDIKSVELIINTTPLGTFPNNTTSPPICYEQLTRNHYLFDLVYNPTKTTFLSKGEAQNAHIQNGLDMLHYQAEFAWKLWHNDHSRI